MIETLLPTQKINSDDTDNVLYHSELIDQTRSHFVPNYSLKFAVNGGFSFYSQRIVKQNRFYFAQDLTYNRVLINSQSYLPLPVCV